MRHSPEKLNRMIDAVWVHTSGLERLIALGLPILPADEANKEVLRLTVENMRLQAELDAYRMREEKPCSHEK
jgi:hypothetical protein